MDSISQGVSVSLGTLCVGALGSDMVIWTVITLIGYKPERIAVGCDTPGLPEQLAPGACCLAGKAVHTTIKIIWRKPPLVKWIISSSGHILCGDTIWVNNGKSMGASVMLRGGRADGEMLVKGKGCAQQCW